VYPSILANILVGLRPVREYRRLSDLLDEENSMQINISGRQMDITPAIRDYCHSKLDRLSRYYDNITKAEVILSVDKVIQKAEARVHINGHDLFAGSEDEDLYAAIDTLSDKLNRQLLKHKEKSQNHR
jgi:putative sigma-54 modulation protein